MTKNNFLLNLRDIQSTTLNQALADVSIEKSLCEALQQLDDMAICVNQIGTRKEFEVFNFALRELNQSLLLSINGHYRQSYAAQRLALELWFAAIKFSTDDFSFRKWMADEKDIVWNNLINVNDGILSVGFAHVYWPEAKENVNFYCNTAEKLYRECSQYVHGNSATHKFLPSTFGYSKKSLDQWITNITTITFLCLYTFVLRFNKELDVVQFSKLSNILTEHLGHISAVRILIKEGGAK